MSSQKSWKTTVLYAGAILFGIVFGQAAAGLAGHLPGFSRGPTQAQALAAPAAATAPDSPVDTYVCTPSFVGTFPNRVHVLCTVPGPNGIWYYAASSSDPKYAARVLAVMLTAKALGKNLQIYYDPAGDGSSFGCQVSDCRPITAVEVMN